MNYSVAGSGIPTAMRMLCLALIFKYRHILIIDRNVWLSILFGRMKMLAYLLV